MEYIEGLISAFGTPTVVIAIIAFLGWFTKKHTQEHTVILQQLARDSAHLATLTTGQDAMQINQHDLTLMVLKGLITNDNLPRSARIEAFDDYRHRGGNSWVQAYAEENLITRDLFNSTEPNPKRRATDK